MVQLNLSMCAARARHDTLSFSFHTRASLHMHARLMTSNLPCIALVYTRRVHDACVHVRNAQAKFFITRACKL